MRSFRIIFYEEIRNIALANVVFERNEGYRSSNELQDTNLASKEMLRLTSCP